MFRNDKDIKPRKKSYYPFAKNYPGRRTGTTYVIGESRTRRKKERANTIVYAIGLLVVFVLAFVVGAVALKLSGRPLDDGAAHTADDLGGQLKTVYMSADELAGGIAFDLFQNTLSEVGANAVLLDFKDADGYLCTQVGGTPADIGAESNAVADAAQTVARLKEAGYRVFVRIYCFRDPLAAAGLPGAAVTEADGVTVWLDDSARNDGDPWLNPYSETARNYLLGIVQKAVEFGADAVLLDGVSFPNGRYVERAAFPGEAESLFSHNAVLHDFIELAVSAAGDVPVSVAMPLYAALNGDALLYDGGIFDSAAAFCAVDFARSALPDGTLIGQTKYSADMSAETLLPLACSALRDKLEENYSTKSFVPIIYDRADLEKLESAGVENYIWIAETGA